MCALPIAFACALAASPAAAQRETLTIGITQFPATFHPHIEQMAAKYYVLGMAYRPVTVHGHDWKPACTTRTTLPTLENGLAVAEPGADGQQGVRVTYEFPESFVWATAGR